MSEYVIKVPSSQRTTDWFRFVNESLDTTDQVTSLVVDFNNVRFMETDDFVVLACIIESFYLKGATISFTGGIKSFNNHLSNIKFKEYWKPGFDRTAFTLSRNRTTLCLWKVSEAMIYSYSTYARKYFEGFTENKDLIPLSSNMDQVFNNIFDHSHSEVTGYIITQYYPKINKLSFAVCDFGIGIPGSINSSDLVNANDYEDWKAILKSLEKGVSIKSTPRNRGFGLNNLLELTESSNGKLEIISNNGLVLKEAGEMYRGGNLNFNFKGTLIKVDLDLNTFDKKDETDEIFEL